MPEQCAACQAPAMGDTGFCSRHQTAFSSLEAAYQAWNKAFGGSLSKQQYFVKLETLPETGKAIKEIIRHLRQKGGSR